VSSSQESENLRKVGFLKKKSLIKPKKDINDINISFIGKMNMKKEKESQINVYYSKKQQKSNFDLDAEANEDIDELRKLISIF
jgi:hypothetical protein